MRSDHTRHCTDYLQALLKEFLDVPHGDEACWGGRDHDDWITRLGFTSTSRWICINDIKRKCISLAECQSFGRKETYQEMPGSALELRDYLMFPRICAEPEFSRSLRSEGKAESSVRVLIVPSAGPEWRAKQDEHTLTFPPPDVRSTELRSCSSTSSARS